MKILFKILFVLLFTTNFVQAEIVKPNNGIEPYQVIKIQLPFMRKQEKRQSLPC